MTGGWSRRNEYWQAFLDSERKRDRKRKDAPAVPQPLDTTEHDKRIIIQQYVRTGEGIEALEALGRRVVKAAKKQRASNIKKKEKALSSFVAVCECPACERIDVHWLTSSGRECKRCGHEWYQQLNS